jgi:hypothetical protein
VRRRQQGLVPERRQPLRLTKEQEELLRDRVLDDDELVVAVTAALNGALDELRDEPPATEGQIRAGLDKLATALRQAADAIEEVSLLEVHGRLRAWLALAEIGLDPEVAHVTLRQAAERMASDSLVPARPKADAFAVAIIERVLPVFAKHQEAITQQAGPFAVFGSSPNSAWRQALAVCMAAANIFFDPRRLPPLDD